MWRGPCLDPADDYHITAAPIKRLSIQWRVLSSSLSLCLLPFSVFLGQYSIRIPSSSVPLGLSG